MDKLENNNDKKLFWVNKNVIEKEFQLIKILKVCKIWFQTSLLFSGQDKIKPKSSQENVAITWVYE